MYVENLTSKTKSAMKKLYPADLMVKDQWHDQHEVA